MHTSDYYDGINASESLQPINLLPSLEDVHFIMPGFIHFGEGETRANMWASARRSLSHFNKNIELIASTISEKSGISPFPLIDDFVTSLACKGGPVGRISQWLLKSTSMPRLSKPCTKQLEHNSRCTSPSHSPKSENWNASCSKVPEVGDSPIFILEYQIVGNRFCHNIHRAHKSNNIMFEVNLNRGYVCQKCWDVDCKGFRSQPIYIPVQICPSLLEVHDHKESSSR